METSTKPERAGLSPEEEETAARYLANARAGLADATKDLSEAQGNFKVGTDQWSVAEIVEHLAIVGNRVIERLENLSQGSAASPNRDNEAIAARAISIMTNRSTKAQAPEIIRPTSLLNLETARQRLLEADVALDNALRTIPGLREHIGSHPVLGELDGYQWILIHAAHIIRHTDQIWELKGAPDFPRQ